MKSKNPPVTPSKSKSNPQKSSPGASAPQEKRPAQASVSAPQNATPAGKSSSPTASAKPSRKPATISVTKTTEKPAEKPAKKPATKPASKPVAKAAGSEKKKPVPTEKKPVTRSARSTKPVGSTKATPVRSIRPRKAAPAVEVSVSADAPIPMSPERGPDPKPSLSPADSSAPAGTPGNAQPVASRSRVRETRPLPEFPPVLLAGDFPPAELWPSDVRPAPAPPRASLEIPTDTSGFPSGAALWMRPRDPYCVVIFWQTDPAALETFAAGAGAGTWRLRVTGGLHPGQSVLDDVLSLATDHQFVAVTDAGCRYVSEIGFLSADGSWRELARSSPITTPVAGPTATWIPKPPPAVSVAPEVSTPHEPDRVYPDPEQMPAPPPAKHSRFRSVDFKPVGPAIVDPVSTLSPSEADSLALHLLVWEASGDRGAPNSGEAAHWFARSQSVMLPGQQSPRPDQRPVAHPTASLPSSGDLPPAAPKRPGFWFEVNAELIVYGRTEPDASVTIGGRPVTLRKDGSFRFRFSLPDGEYELPVVAVNARKDDGRSARLEFARSTAYSGDVGTHPQDPSLNPPGVEAIASTE